MSSTLSYVINSETRSLTTKSRLKYKALIEEGAIKM